MVPSSRRLLDFPHVCSEVLGVQKGQGHSIQR